MKAMTRLRIVVISSLFPSAAQPAAGLFVRERVFRVGQRVPLVVVSPQPWFPLQGAIRRFRPGYRPVTARQERQDGFDVYFPRFFAVPGVLRRFDGFFMALGCLPLLLRLRRSFSFTLIDAHFGYPSGYAATLLGRWLRVPVTVTLRGTEPGHLRTRALRVRVVAAVARAARVFAVSDSLRKIFVDVGADAAKIGVIGNGVDLTKFRPIPRSEARAELGIPANAKVLVSVGGLVERKGFHRVIDVIPALRQKIPDLRYLIVGGPSPEGDMSAELHDRVRRLGLESCITFMGTFRPEDLHRPLSASDVFVLATGNEGWANVFLEAMACGLPVVTTDVGGNREVVCKDTLGIVVPFGDPLALTQAIETALSKPWDREAIIAYARANAWDTRITALVDELAAIVDETPAAGRATVNA
jgi:glycosyltransferase involved in cell wall biosynthesis